MADQPTLQTDRLTLRPFTLDDAAEVRPLVGEKEIAATTLNIPHPYPDGEAERWISKHKPSFHEGNAATFAIILSETGKLIGAISLGIDRKHSHAEMGYWIGKPYWNNGYCTEAAREILRYGFKTLDLNRIYSHHMTKNPQSGRVMQKIGMANEGMLVQHVIKDGKYQDLVLYGITQDQYNS